MSPQELTQDIERYLLKGDYVRCEELIATYTAAYTEDPFFDQVRVDRARKWVENTKLFIEQINALDKSSYDIVTLREYGNTHDICQPAATMEDLEPGLYTVGQASVFDDASETDLTAADEAILSAKGFFRKHKDTDHDQFRIGRLVRFCNVHHRAITCFDASLFFNKFTSSAFCRRTRLNASRKPTGTIPFAYILPVPYGRNFYHFTAETIYGLRFIDRLHVPAPIIYQDDRFGLIDFYGAQLGVARNRFVKISDVDHCVIETCVMPENPNFYWNRAMYQFFRGLIKGQEGTTGKPKRRVYISRSLASRRPVNEDAVEAMLKDYGFAIVHTETIGIHEQATLFNQADIIISPHGAALTNMLFARPGTMIVEVFNPDYIDPQYCIRSKGGGLRYKAIIADQTNHHLDIISDLVKSIGS
jgi:hypothetical protein